MLENKLETNKFSEERHAMIKLPEGTMDIYLAHLPSYGYILHEVLYNAAGEILRSGSTGFGRIPPDEMFENYLAMRYGHMVPERLMHHKNRKTNHGNPRCSGT